MWELVEYDDDDVVEIYTVKRTFYKNSEFFYIIKWSKKNQAKFPIGKNFKYLKYPFLIK